MQYSLVFATAALAQLASAGHERLHARDVKVEWSYVTVTEYVTAGQPSATHSHRHSHSSATVEESPATSVALAASSSPISSAEQVLSTSSSSSAEPSTSTSTSTSISATVTLSAVNKGVSAYGSSSATSAEATSTGISKTNLTPAGRKAGLSGYIGIQDKDAFAEYAPYISWYSDYTATTPDAHGVQGIGMLWGGDGSTCADTQTRLTAYNDMVSAKKIPDIMFGFYEPDCNCPDSAGMTTAEAASDWDNLIAPLAKDGTVLGSPSMCKQKDEDFLTPFNSSISTTWDVTSIHVNKPDLDGVKAVVEYYWDTYQKPIWVSEFACVVDTPSWAPCTDQSQINSFINDAVAYFNDNEHVVAFGPSNGNGLGNVWPLTDSNGKLTTSGTTYLNAIKSL